jgi:hypothetical protein
VKGSLSGAYSQFNASGRGLVVNEPYLNRVARSRMGLIVVARMQEIMLGIIFGERRFDAVLPRNVARLCATAETRRRNSSARSLLWFHLSDIGLGLVKIGLNPARITFAGTSSYKDEHADLLTL